MANIIRKFFTWAKPLKQGVFHYRSGGMLEGHRVHLRIETNGSGLLIIDADKILYLNQTAAEILKDLLDGMSDEDVVNNMVGRYRVGRDAVAEDVDSLKHAVKRFAEATDVDPVTYLSHKDISLFTTAFSAPHRMDILLSYERGDLYRRFCSSSKQDIKAITFDQWKRVIEILWNIGVPHILFAGGEPTEQEHFVDLVRFAEEVGIVTGLLTNGERLESSQYTDSLVDSGLDHLQVSVLSHHESIHNEFMGKGSWQRTVKGLENALATPLYCVAHATFMKKNITDIAAFIAFLKKRGVYAFAANALQKGYTVNGNELALSEEEVRGVVDQLTAETQKHDVSFVWYGNEMDDSATKPSGVWEYSMCIEPNGDVSPCERDYCSFGNILEQPWKEIWNRSIQHNKKRSNSQK